MQLHELKELLRKAEITLPDFEMIASYWYNNDSQPLSNLLEELFWRGFHLRQTTWFLEQDAEQQRADSHAEKNETD